MGDVKDEEGGGSSCGRGGDNTNTIFKVLHGNVMP